MEYPHVDSLLAQASIDIAKALCGWDEVPIADEPATLAAAIAHYQRTGRIAVARAEDFVSGEKRLWGTAEAWQSFFVWHDHAHITVPGGTFDPKGERVVHAVQMAQLSRWVDAQDFEITYAQFDRMEAVIEAHNIARLEHWRVYGEPPANLRDFAHGYLAARGLAEEM